MKALALVALVAAALAGCGMTPAARCATAQSVAPIIGGAGVVSAVIVCAAVPLDS